MEASSGLEGLLVPGSGAGEPTLHLVGGKAASLFWMTGLGVPVPPFFVLTTDAWQRWNRRQALDDELIGLVGSGMADLESTTSSTFGAGPRPLLVSVRSSGLVSMPGMMDTVLNLGLSPESIAALAHQLDDLAALAGVVNTFLSTFRQSGTPDSGELIPLSARSQLTAAIEKVFSSWNNDRARLYRKMRRIPEDTGTALIVQAMVFGNWDRRSGSGVLFTRDPISGAPVPMGEWAPGAQGEAVVAGRITPRDLDQLAAEHPDLHAELEEHSRRLEREGQDAQDIEYTVQSGRLYLLQARRLKVTPLAACRIGVDLWREGLIDDGLVTKRLQEIDLESLSADSVDAEGVEPLAVGLAASPGVASGWAVASTEEALRETARGQRVVLVRPETSPNDLPGMRSAVAVITERGGVTSHAAIVARELRIPCVVGCGALASVLQAGMVTVETGEGGVGRILPGEHPIRREVPAFVRTAQNVIQGTAAPRRETPR
ncbi:MAG: pyruvate, phosphate dikinase [Candidatus Nephthysia bennettiae]|uniref:Pyruvate, phosphate dikinase n=1 Tax=Candidatus Nephthysia bennettiae TaxID=3127016 RepID=A0A934KEC9_9BACT|nr:pyruvate, phosphate dikinase [Candidatus Dormibacteraeota bacterium]MBJ7614014.1 pyruvate, phosphate dikinase [Candidatus Dormibacteraeota bacterium]PZR90141.1 MAG: pyruvate, phosphate dikinase [Candidatus Dormibacteraeota bacterium]